MDVLIYIVIIFIFLFFFGRVSLLLKSPIIPSALIVIFLTTISVIFPLFSYLFAIGLSSIILFLSLPLSLFENLQHTFIRQFLKFLYKCNILDLLAVINVTFFCVPSVVFFKRLFTLTTLSLIHIFFSRWYFLKTRFEDQVINLPISNSIIFLISFLLICISYLRFVLSLSIFIVPLAIKNTPQLLSPGVLYVFGEESDYVDDKPPSNDFSKRKFSLINIDRSRHYYKNYSTSSHNTYFRYAGFCIGACAMSAAVAAAYYSKLQADYSKQQAYDTRREADAAAVDSGLITKEEYWRRHPEDAKNKPL